jgi:hypothetical protein
VPGIGDRLDARTADAAGEHLRVAGRRNRVVGADDHEGRHFDLAEQRLRVGALGHAEERTLQRVGRGDIDHVADPLDELRVLAAGRVGDELRQHRVTDRCGAVRAHLLGECVAAGPGVGAVGGGARVAEHEPPDALRERAHERQRDVATHRKAAEHGFRNVERVEQRRYVRGEDVHRVRAGAAGGTGAEAAQVGGDEVPAVGRALELRLPLHGVEGEAVQQHERAALSRLAPVQPDVIDGRTARRVAGRAALRHAGHARGLAIRRAHRQIPSDARMSGSIRSGVHCGEKVSSTSALSTPSTPSIAAFASSTIWPATGQKGDVSDILVCTCESLISIS